MQMEMSANERNARYTLYVLDKIKKGLESTADEGFPLAYTLFLFPQTKDWDKPDAVSEQLLLANLKALKIIAEVRERADFQYRKSADNTKKPNVEGEIYYLAVVKSLLNRERRKYSLLVSSYDKIRNKRGPKNISTIQSVVKSGLYPYFYVPTHACFIATFPEAYSINLNADTGNDDMALVFEIFYEFLEGKGIVSGIYKQVTVTADEIITNLPGKAHGTVNHRWVANTIGNIIKRKIKRLGKLISITPDKNRNSYLLKIRIR